MTYTIFDPKVNKPMHELRRDDAQAAYDWFISNVPIRLSELSGLLSSSGISLNFSEEALTSLHDWFFDFAMVEHHLGKSSPSPELFSICNDIGVYLSEYVIQAGRNIHWSFFTSDANGLSYQRPVITGFVVKNADYYIDFDYLICQYAFRIIKRGKKENAPFLAIIKRTMTII
jgi:hypothetical protein